MEKNFGAGVAKSSLPPRVSARSSGLRDEGQATVFARVVHAITDDKIAYTGEAGEVGACDRVLAALVDGDCGHDFARAGSIQQLLRLDDRTPDIEHAIDQEHALAFYILARACKER